LKGSSFLRNFLDIYLEGLRETMKYHGQDNHILSKIQTGYLQNLSWLVPEQVFSNVGCSLPVVPNLKLGCY